MLGFETLTLAPIDRNLIDPSLLTDGRDRLARRLPCPGAADIGPLVDGETAKWLAAVTRPLAP